MIWSKNKDNSRAASYEHGSQMWGTVDAVLCELWPGGCAANFIVFKCLCVCVCVCVCMYVCMYVCVGVCAHARMWQDVGPSPLHFVSALQRITEKDQSIETC